MKDIRNYLLDPKVWRFSKSGSIIYTCHDKANECDCGTCSGARCCDDKENYPTKYQEPDRLVLITEEVYGDSFIELTCKGKLVDDIRRGAAFSEGFNLYYSIELPIENNNLSQKARDFYNKLYEVYKIVFN